MNGLSPATAEHYEERRAIRQIDGGLSAPLADAAAHQDTVRWVLGEIHALSKLYIETERELRELSNRLPKNLDFLK